MTNGTNENDIIRHKRRGYLSYYAQGIEDACCDENLNSENVGSLSMGGAQDFIWVE